MSSRPFTKHAQRVLNKNPNVEKCTTAKVIFKEEFALKVCEALKKGEDPFQVFTDNGLSVRVLGRSRINGVLGLWRSKYGLEGLPRRKVVRKSKPAPETAKERKARIFQEAVTLCDSYIAKPEELGLTPDTDLDVIRFTAIKKVYDTKKGVILKDLCLHYGYPYSKYYAYNRTLTPDEDTFVNILNPHRKK